MAAEGNVNVHEYTVDAQSTATFGRLICSARQHHVVVDGPVQNGCPGEALTPAELFLAGVASCGVELVQVLARQQDLPLAAVRTSVRGAIDRGRPVRADVTVFNSVRLDFELTGVTPAQAEGLIEAFKGR